MYSKKKKSQVKNQWFFQKFWWEESVDDLECFKHTMHLNTKK